MARNLPLPAGFQKPVPTVVPTDKVEAKFPDKKTKKAMSKVKKAGTYKGKSNKLGFGGRAQQLKDQGVPGGVIGNLARAQGAAKGGPNYHGGKKK